MSKKITPVNRHEFHDVVSKLVHPESTETFMDFCNAQKAEQAAFELAMWSGVDAMVIFRNWKRDHGRNEAHKASCEARKEVEALIPTGDVEYDQFRKDVRFFDVYWRYSDDHGVCRRGQAEEDRLMSIIKEKGGMYEKYWRHFMGIKK
jgi:hypothetical protein